MTFKSHRQPLCRACGKKIGKRTEDIYVYDKPPKTHFSDGTPCNVFKHIVGKFRSKEEIQPFVNEKIVSVARSLDGEFIHRLSVWDGESYKDEFFCKGTCAHAYAYMMAKAEPRHGIVSVAYNDSLREQDGKKPR